MYALYIFTILLFFNISLFIFVELIRASCDCAVVPINEAVHAAEVILGPYMADEHAWCTLVMQDTRVNRAYRGKGSAWQSSLS